VKVWDPLPYRRNGDKAPRSLNAEKCARTSCSDRHSRLRSTLKVKAAVGNEPRLSDSVHPHCAAVQARFTGVPTDGLISE
jgi:hypothetical protein